MDASQLKKLSESYATIAEGGKHEKSAMDWNKSDDNPKGKKVDKKKVDKCTCESFYLKRLKAMDPVMAEKYLAIAEILIEEGYQSSRLIDNIIEALPKEIIGEEFRAALHAVNPRIYENLDTAEKRQARSTLSEFNLMQKLRDVGNSVKDFVNPPRSKSADPVVRAGGKYTGRGGTAVLPSPKKDTAPATPSSSAVASQQPSTSRPASPAKNQGTGERSAAANDAKQQAAKKANQSKTTTTTKTTPTKERTGPITSKAAIAAGSKEGKGPKSAASTYRDPKDTKGTSIGRYKTLAQHRAAVASKKSVSEGLASMVDDATKKAQGSLEKLGVKINRTPKPTVTKAKQQEKIKMNEQELDEVIGGKPGDGYIGHPNLDIKNPLAKKQVKAPTGNQGLAGKLGDRKMKMDAMMKQLNQSVEPEGEMVEGLGQARKNVGASTCWDGYKAKGTKKKGGKDVPNCVKEGETIEEKKGLWDNIHAKRKRGESPAKKGDKDYPKTLNVEGVMSKDKEDHDTGGFRISDKKAKEAKERLKKKKAEHDNRYSDGTGEESKKKKEALEKKRGMKLDDHPQFTRDDYNIYDIILSFLDENNLMESVEEAEEIMMQLTGAQIVEIIDEFMNDPSVVEQKATAVDGHGNTYRDYNNDGLSDRQKRMKKFGDKRAAMLAKGV